ncbi:GNAT family N-acetyltransferase [Mycolicibacterium duvalii]|nr:GNAT family N-acetyltransferase [Mycolicibacterium duvalii]PEG38189.1 GNAT family N-acetyltransferase [Mycolicibacterium duvalii]
MFCSTELGARIEAAEAELIVAATEAARDRGGWGVAMPLAGGFACAAAPGSPMNKVVGLGFGGTPDAACLDEVERTLAGMQVPVQVELSNLADPEVAHTLTIRGYRLVGFENVLGLLLPSERAAGYGVTVRRCESAELEVWADAVVDGFAHPDDVGVPSHEDFPRDIVQAAVRDVEKAGAVAYLALCGDAVAGGASMRTTHGVAQLTGAATVPGFRRRGVQTALLAARLDDAAAAGCDIAVVTTAPGSTSQKNVQRFGFHLLYTRAVLVRDPV